MSRSHGVLVADAKGLPLNEYPLRAEDLDDGQFAEANNGTIVVKLSPRTWKSAEDGPNPIINIANGVGGYL